MRPRAGISTSEIHFTIAKMVSAVRAHAQKCPRRSTNPLAQTVYPLQGGKVHPNFQNKKKFRKKIFSLHYDQKNTLNPLVKSFLNPLTIKGDICNFVTAVCGLSNTSKRSVYN